MTKRLWVTYSGVDKPNTDKNNSDVDEYDDKMFPQFVVHAFPLDDVDVR